MIFELRVLNGMQCGAALPLGDNTCFLGRGEDQDLQLLDDGINDKHAALVQCQEHWSLCIFSPGENGSESVDNTIYLDKPFNLGSVSLVISPIDQPWKHADNSSTCIKSSSKSIYKSNMNYQVEIIMAALTVLMSVLFIIWFFWPATHAEPLVQPITESERIEILETDEVKALLSEWLRHRGLHSLIDLKIESNRVILSGNLLPKQMDIVERMLKDYEQRYISPVTIKNNTKFIETTLPFSIRQISLQKPGYIITNDGFFMYVGDELDGVRLINITPTYIEFGGEFNMRVNW